MNGARKGKTMGGMIGYGGIKLFAGSACQELAQEIADYLFCHWSPTTCSSSRMRTCSCGCGVAFGVRMCT